MKFFKQTFNNTHWEKRTDTRRENSLSSKTKAFTESKNMDICVISTLNQFSRRGSYTENKFFKK